MLYCNVFFSNQDFKTYFRKRQTFYYSRNELHFIGQKLMREGKYLHSFPTTAWATAHKLHYDCFIPLACVYCKEFMSKYENESLKYVQHPIQSWKK